MTIKELEENLKEGITAGGSSSNNLEQAKVIGIACDVCNANDVERLANFVVSELGSVDIWINNSGTNKGFRPLLQFSDEDIKQCLWRADYVVDCLHKSCWLNFLHSRSHACHIKSAKEGAHI